VGREVKNDEDKTRKMGIRGIIPVSRYLRRRVYEEHKKKPDSAPNCLSGRSISGIPAKNDAVLHIFSKIAFSSRFTPNGAISFEI
jgi:hypothetical protein